MAEQLYQKYKNDGFIILHVLLTSKQSDTEKWAKDFGLTFPVLADLLWVAYKMFNEKGYIPLNVLMNRQLVIVYKDIGYNETAIENKIVEIIY